MTSDLWWDYFDDDPYETLGRHMPDSFGHPVVIELSRISWAYLDWIAEREDCDLRKLFLDNDLLWRPEDGCRKTWTESLVKTAYLRREKRGLPRPPWCPPANPFEFLDI